MMNKNLYHLRVLEAIQIQGSVTGAARVLHITQPAVSNILKQLEESYGYPMIETIGKKVYFTDVGKRVLKMAKEIDEVLHKTQTEIDRINHKLSGKLSVTIASTAKYFMPKMLGAFKHQYPAVNIKLQVCNRNDAIESLKRNENDFLIMSQPPNDFPVEQRLFYEDELVVAASSAFELKKKEVLLADLSSCDWIIREPGSGTRIMMGQLFKRAKIVPNILMEVGNNESIKQLIMADMGLSIISRQSIELELNNKIIKILPVKNFPIKHPWYLVTPKGKGISELTKQFITFSKENMNLIHANPK